MTMQPNHDDRFELRFDDRLMLALRRSGLGVQEVADRLEVSRNAVSSWINGHNRPRPRDLKAFALATGYPVDWLRDGIIEVSPTPPRGGSSTPGPIRFVGPEGLEPSTRGLQGRRFTIQPHHIRRLPEVA